MPGDTAERPRGPLPSEVWVVASDTRTSLPQFPQKRLSAGTSLVHEGQWVIGSWSPECLAATMVAESTPGWQTAGSQAGGERSAISLSLIPTQG